MKDNVEYLVTYEKRKFLTFKVKACSLEEAFTLADDYDEKFGVVYESPYVRATSSAFVSEEKL